MISKQRSGIVAGLLIVLLILLLSNQDVRMPFQNRRDRHSAGWVYSSPIFDQRGGVVRIDVPGNTVIVLSPAEDAAPCRYDIRIADGEVVIYDQKSGETSRTGLIFVRLKDQMVIVRSPAAIHWAPIGGGLAQRLEVEFQGYRGTSFESLLEDLRSREGLIYTPEE